MFSRANVFKANVFKANVFKTADSGELFQGIDFGAGFPGLIPV
jgi:hypothetical protein